jgi:hypothetical protein
MAALRNGPRLAGTIQHRAGCEWARDQFAEFGLKNAHLETCAHLPVGFQRGRSTGAIKSPISKRLHFSTPAWTPGTGGKARARAVLAPGTVAELENSPGTLDGLWVLWRPTGDREKDASYIEAWDALKQDVAGVITPSSGELIHTMGSPWIDRDHPPTTPAIVLLQSEWEEIADMISQQRKVTLEFDIRNHFKKGPIPVHNVVADIPGAEKPDEYVIIGAHIDSRDGAPGATDNGTGVAAALEAARLLMAAGVTPKRTIRFVLFGGEEVGLLGSKGYVRDHPELMPKISAMFNMDQGADHISGILATDAMIEDFERVFAPVKNLDPEMAFAVERVDHLPKAADCNAPAPTSPLNASGCGEVLVRGDADAKAGPGDTPSSAELEDSKGCGSKPSKGGLNVGQGCAVDQSTPKGMKKIMMIGSSDHAPFLNAGTPAFMWLQKGKTPVPYYPHTQKDTYDQVIPEYQAHSAAVIALAALGTANLDHLLSREKLQEEPGSPASVSERTTP